MRPAFFFATLSQMKPLGDCKLYTFVDTAYLRGRAPELIAQQLCDGGADLIQLRAKHSPVEDVRRMAEQILAVTRAANVGLVINDHLDIARDLGAELGHLGQEDFFEAGHQHVSELRTPNSASDFRRTRLSRPSVLSPPARITSPSARFTPPAPSPRPNR